MNKELRKREKWDLKHWKKVWWVGIEQSIW